MDSIQHKGDADLRMENILDAGCVQRFHATPSVPTQSVGEHCYGVVAIAAYITRQPSPNFLLACLLHDSAELRTGDIPFTAKRGCLKEIRHALEAAEEAVLKECMCPLPVLSRREGVILKLADMLEGLRYVKNNERGERQIVADRWSNALSVAFASEDIQYLHRTEIDRAYKLFKNFSPYKCQHRVCGDAEQHFLVHTGLTLTTNDSYA